MTRGLDRRRLRYAPQLLLALVCASAWACVEEETAPEPAEAVVEGVAGAGEEEPGAEPGLRPFLPDEMQRSTRLESFPHDPHEQIDCAVCHEAPAGHGSHGELSCADCHRSSANVRVAALSPEECQSCHHAADQAVACETCHEGRPAVTSVQTLSLEVWDAPQERALDFEHAAHEELTCESCHRALPTLTPAESCASCHTEHHSAEIECASCHVEPAPAAHGVEAHLTCSGSGCHRAPEVEAIAASRTVCLACHTEQVEHEPGGDCVECHSVGPGTLASAVWRHP